MPPDRIAPGKLCSFFFKWVMDKSSERDVKGICSPMETFSMKFQQEVSPVKNASVKDFAEVGKDPNS